MESNYDEHEAAIARQVAKAIWRKIEHAYRDRDDYPPFALAAWDDRSRFREYIHKLIDEFIREHTPEETE